VQREKTSYKLQKRGARRERAVMETGTRGEIQNDRRRKTGTVSGVVETLGSTLARRRASRRRAEDAEVAFLLERVEAASGARAARNTAVSFSVS
jgi:hypothetical protein